MLPTPGFMRAKLPSGAVAPASLKLHECIAWSLNIVETGGVKCWDFPATGL